MEPKTKTFKVLDSTVILEDYGIGKGGIIIATHGTDMNFSYSWCAMGNDDIYEFIASIGADYFTRKLSNNPNVFSARNSVKEIRRYIREDMKYDLPRYKYMSGQKELRERLSEIKNICDSEREFVDYVSDLHRSLSLFDMDRKEEYEFRELLKDTFGEAWNFIMHEPSIEIIYLEKLLVELKKQLSLQPETV